MYVCVCSRVVVNNTIDSTSVVYMEGNEYRYSSRGNSLFALLDYIILYTTNLKDRKRQFLVKMFYYC